MVSKMLKCKRKVFCDAIASVLYINIISYMEFTHCSA